ncbi:MAG TPA: hypothetical protein VG621_03275 [Candidatus Paceibacterota bacterium]|nr:hypothetical protein [Candidatus Paceibacterota bacterium]
MNKLLFVESLLRSFIALAKATWIRSTPSWQRPFIWMVRYLQFITLLCISIVASPKRAGLMFILYGWFRPIDDILDGNDKRVAENIEWLIKKNNRLMSLLKEDSLTLPMVWGNDRLLIVACKIAQSLGFDRELRLHVRSIWELMITEYRWKTLGIVPTARELDAFAKRQDQAIFFLAAIVLKVDLSFFDAVPINRLGVFTRIDWLYDFAEDYKEGLVHVPSEIWQHIDASNNSNIMKNEKVHEAIRGELRAITLLWRDVEPWREKLKRATRIKLAGIFYDRYVVGRFASQIKNLCETYGVVI